MFRKLCGDETLRNVVIVTNMWGEVTLEKGAARELELRTDDVLFKPVIDKGAVMVRHDNTLGSAQAIMRQLVDNKPRALRIQRELVDEGKDITQTAAGEELNRELAAMQKKHLAELAEIQREMEEALAAKDMETKEELEKVRQDLLRNVEKIENDRERLSKEYADERAKADAKVREIEEALQAEKDARAERQNEIERLGKEIENTRAHNAQERAMMNQQLEEMRRANRRRGGFFSAIGRGIDSLFGL